HDLFGKPVSTFPDHALAALFVRLRVIDRTGSGGMNNQFGQRPESDPAPVDAMVRDETTRHVHDLDQINLVAVRGRPGIFPCQLASVGEEMSRPIPAAEAVRRATEAGGEKVPNGPLTPNNSRA